MTNDPNQEISKQVKPVFLPDCQDDLIKFIDDPETINKAVEGSMDKRAKVLTDSRELDSILEQYFHYKITEKDRQDPLYKGLIEWRTANKQLEAIGEDEPVIEWRPDLQAHELNARAEATLRNQLRAAQRNQLKNKKESI